MSDCCKKIIVQNEIGIPGPEGPAYTPPYLIYKAFIKQPDDATPPFECTIDNLPTSPTDTPFQNTLNGVWEYVSAGTFEYIKVGAFANPTKVDVVFGSNTGQQGANVTVYASILDDDTLRVYSAKMNAFVTTSLSFENDLMKAQPIEIIVYD